MNPDGAAGYLAVAAAIAAAVAAFMSWKAQRDSGRESELLQLREQFMQSGMRHRFRLLNTAFKEERWVGTERVKAALISLGEEPELQYQDVRLLVGSGLAPLKRVAPKVPRIQFPADGERRPNGAMRPLEKACAEIVAGYEGISEEFLNGLFGLPADRADMLDFATLVFRIANWVGRESRKPWPWRFWRPWLVPSRIKRVANVFGRDLIYVMSWHRRFAARLYKVTAAGDDYEYYRRYYGLTSSSYTNLLDLVTSYSVQTGLITEDDAAASHILELWLREQRRLDSTRLRGQVRWRPVASRRI